MHVWILSPGESERPFSETEKKLSSNWAASSIQSHLISFWFLQLWMLRSHLQKETHRLQNQKRACLSDVVYCNTGQLRWMLCPVIMLKEELWVFCFFFFYTALSHYPSERGWVVAHLTATESNYEEICRQNVSHIIFFFSSTLTQKYGWRAQLVLRIPFEPHTILGQAASRSDRSRNTESYSQLCMIIHSEHTQHDESSLELELANQNLWHSYSSGRLTCRIINYKREGSLFSPCFVLHMSTSLIITVTCSHQKVILKLLLTTYGCQNEKKKVAVQQLGPTVNLNPCCRWSHCCFCK